MIIRTDGSLAPCFPMYSATHDWGVVGDHRFDVKQLDEMKKECTKHCLSTCNYILGYLLRQHARDHMGLEAGDERLQGIDGKLLANTLVLLSSPPEHLFISREDAPRKFNSPA